VSLSAPRRRSAFGNRRSSHVARRSSLVALGLSRSLDARKRSADKGRRIEKKSDCFYGGPGHPPGVPSLFRNSELRHIKTQNSGHVVGPPLDGRGSDIVDASILLSDVISTLHGPHDYTVQVMDRLWSCGSCVREYAYLSICIVCAVTLNQALYQSISRNK